MQKNKLNLSLLLIATVFLSVVFVSAVVTINTPASSSTVSGNTTFNVTITGYVGVDKVNLTFYVGSSLSANTTWTQIGTNNSLNLTLLSNETITNIDLVHLIEDANDYVINVTVKNATSGAFVGDDTNTGIIVDQTVPQTPTSLTPASASTDTDGDVTFSSTVVGVNTTSCTLYFTGINPGNPSYSMTHTGNTCSHALTGISEQTYTWYVIASDETNSSSASSTSTVEIAIPTGGGGTGGTGGTTTTTTGEEESNMLWWILGIVIAIIVIVVIYNRK